MIHNVVVDGGIRLVNASLGNITLELVTAKHILLSKVTVSKVNLTPFQSRPQQLPLKDEERDGTLSIDTVRLDDRLAILGGSYDAIKIAHMKVDDLFIYYPDWPKSNESSSLGLSITELVATEVSTLQADPKALPTRIKFD